MKHYMIVSLAAVQFCAVGAFGAVIIGNSPATAGGGGNSIGAASTLTYMQAVVFQSPSVPNWTLEKVTLRLQNAAGSSPYDLSATLYLASGTHTPTGSALASSTQTISITSSALYEIPLSGSGWTLSAGTEYALVFSMASGGGDRVSWYVASPAKAYSTSDGFTFVGRKASNDGGVNWTTTSNNNIMALQASVPEPGEYALVATLGLGGFAVWRRSRKCNFA
jgi:hypothetical protein